MNEAETKRKSRVLVVEDENIVALDIEQGLKRLGYEVSAVVNNGKDAIKEAMTTHPDLVLMDIQIQGNMDGIQTANEIHKQLKIPVVFLTAYADEATLQRAKEVGPYGYLLKPFEETELHTAIEVVLQKHKTVSEREALSKEALILSEERFKLFVDSNKDYALYMLDKVGNIISWNAGAERIKGYKHDEIVGKNFSVFYTEEDRRSGLPERELKAAATNGKYEEENWRVRNDGSKFWASIVITSLVDDKGQLRGFGKVTRDLTSKKMVEEKLRQAIVSRDEFISIASHELRTPLTTLSLQLQIAKNLLAKESSIGAGAERLSKSLDVSSKSVEALSKLTDQLLDITRIQAGVVLNFDKINLSKLVVDICKDFEKTFELAKIKLECDFQENVYGMWDRIRLGQVLTNLLSNATKYAPGSPVKVSVKADAETAYVTVQDHGTGIPQEMQAKIFERFERAASPSISGLGLGLYISRKMIEAHGGAIKVESEVGKGSIFTVALPRKSKEVLP